MKILYTALYSALLMPLTFSYALAEPADDVEPLKQYDVEIIIFEDAHARYIDSEAWRDSSAGIEDDQASRTSYGRKTTRVEDIKTGTSNYVSLKPGILKKQYNRMNNSSEYNVLLYSAWRQAGLAESDAFEIDVNKLDNTHKRRSENTLSGKVKVVLARYLHFYSELDYQRQGDNSDTKTGDGNNYQETSLNSNTSNLPADNRYSMTSHRRMRSKELHYIDHPLLGILIQINPVESSQTRLETQQISSNL